jgi:DNA-binding NarL/FixJ family response regulator
MPPNSVGQWSARATRSVRDTALRHTCQVVEAGQRRRRVVVAEDDVLMREGLASLLRDGGYDVVGQAGDGAELARLVGEYSPDLAIIDIRMPPTHTTEGLDAARTIREEFPELGILILSAHIEVDHAMTLLASGQGSGYLLKDRILQLDDFLDAVDRVCRGSSVVDPTLVQELCAARTFDDPLEELTPREREVLALMAEGRSNAGIARALWVTEGTVEKHVSNILLKLDLPETERDHRRVLAVIRFLDTRPTG